MRRLNKAIALLLAVTIVVSSSLYSAVSVFAAAENGQIPALDYKESVNSGDYSLKAKVLSNHQGTSVSIEESGLINQNILRSSPLPDQTTGTTPQASSGSEFQVPGVTATPSVNISKPQGQAVPGGNYGSEVKSVTGQSKGLTDNTQNKTVATGVNNNTSPSEKVQTAGMTPTADPNSQSASSEMPKSTPVSTPETTQPATETHAATPPATPDATATAVPTATSTATSTTLPTATSTSTSAPAATPTAKADSTPTVMPTLTVSHSPLEVNLTSKTTVIHRNETADYTATITNYSKSTITNISVASKNGSTILKESGNTFSLEPGKSAVFTFSYSVTEAEITSGEPILITCQATSDGGLNDVGELPLFPSCKADMKIKKSADRVKAVPGDTINYTAEITNTGEVDITDIIYEDKINYKSGNKTEDKIIYEKKGFSIKPGCTEIIQYSYTVTEKDMRTSGKIVAVSKVQGDAALNSLKDEDQEIIGLTADAQFTTAVYSAASLEYRVYALDIATEWNKIENIAEKYYVQLQNDSPKSVTESVYSPETTQHSYIEVTAVYDGDLLKGWVDKKGNKYKVTDDIKTEYIFSLPYGNSYIVSGTDKSKTVHIDAADKSSIQIDNGAAFDDKYCTCSVFVDNTGNITGGLEKRQVYDFGTKAVTLGSMALNGENLEISAGSISFTKGTTLETILDGQLSLTASGEIDLLNLVGIKAGSVFVIGTTVKLPSLQTNGGDVRVLATNVINIASGSVIDTGKSNGDSGDVSLIAGETIIAPNVKINARTSSPGAYADGDVELKVTNTPYSMDIASYNKTEGISNIELSGEIKGGDITVSGETEIPVLSLPWLNFDSDLTAATLEETFKNILIARFMKGLGSSFPFAFKYTNTKTVVNMNANIDASGDVQIYAESDDGVTANSAFYGAAVAVGHSKAESAVNIGGNINAAGAVNIGTQAQSSAEVNATAKNTFNKYATVNIVESATNLLSKINVGNTSTIKGKEVEISSYGYYKNSVSANTKASGTKVAPTVAVENAHSDVGTSIDGKIESTEGNITINSSLENIDYVTAGSKLGLSWLMKKTMEQVKDSSLYKEGMAKVSAATAAIKKAITGKDSIPEEETSKLKITASFSYQNVDNSINTVIGSNAHITSAGDLIIDSDTKQKVANSAAAKIKKVEYDEASDIAIGGAGAVSIVKNRSKSEINGKLYSNGQLTIDSKIVYPFLFEKVLKADEEVDNIASKAKAVINKINEILNNFSKDKILDELALAEYYQDEYQNFLDQYTSIRLFNSDAGASSVAADVAVAGSVRYIKFDNEAASLIKKGAQINGAEIVQNSNGDSIQQTFDSAVTINSQVDISNLHSVGAYKKYSPFGMESGGTSIGAGVLLKYMENKALSVIESGASVKSSNLQLYSNNKRLDISVVVNGGKSKDFGFSGSAVYNSVNNETKSLISEGAILELGQASIKADDTLNEVDFVGGVNKTPSSSVDGAAGLNEITRNIEAGIKKDDGTVTKINDAIKVTGKMEIASNANGNIYLADIAASVKSDTKVNVSPVGTHSKAMVKPKDPENNLNAITNKAGESGNKSGKFGFGISGSVSYNNVEDNVKAYIDTNRSLNTGDVGINAVNNTGIYSLSGGLAMSTTSGSYTGLAGAVSYNKLTGTTESYVKDTNLSADNLSLNSQRSGRVYTAAAGGSGSSLGSSDTGIAIAGSVTVNDITSHTKAYISGIKGIIKANTGITAQNTSRIASLAGGIGVSSTVGVGASVAYNSIKNNVFANALKSGYQQTGNLTIKAINGDHDDDMDTIDELQKDIDSPDTKASDKMDIISLGVSAGVSKTLSLSGTVSYNIVDNNINAAVEDTNFVDINGNAVKSNGDIQVSALNETDIISLSGAAGVSGKGGFAAAVGINKITGGTGSKIINSKIDTKGKLYNNSSTNSFIVGLAVGISVVSNGLSNLTSDIKVDGLGKGMENGTGDTKNLNSDKMPNTAASPKQGSSSSSGGSFGIGISGSVSVNLIQSDVIAAIENTTSDELIMDVGALANTISDKSKSDIYSLSGAVSAALSSSGSGAVLAGAVSYNEIKGDNKSYIRGIKIQTHKNQYPENQQTGNLYTESAHSGNIYSLAVGGGASTQSSGAVIAGSVTINDIKGDTGAYLESVTGSVEGDTTLKSNDKSSVKTLSGGVAIGSSVGLGLSASASFLDCDTNAVITDSTLTQYGILDISASNGVESKEAKPTGDEKHDKYEKFDYYDILALSLSAGIGKYAGVATCATVSIIENETHANLIKSQINQPKTVKIHATDYSDIGSIAGGAAGALQGGALGASVSYNEIGGAVDAIIDGSSITTGGSLDMSANTDGSIDSVSAGLAMARYASMAGYGTLNLIKRDVVSKVTASDITGMTDSASIKAKENSDVFSIAGAVAALGDAAVGAAVAYNELENNVKAYAAESNILTKGDIDIDAATSGQIEAYSVGVAIAAAMEGEIPVGLALDASVSLTDNKKNVEAYIAKCLASSNHQINSSGNINVHASQKSEFSTLGATLGIGLSAGLDGCVEITTLSNFIRAYIDGSDVSALQKLSVKSESNDTLNLTSSSVGAGAFADIKGQVGVHTLNETTESFITHSTINSDNKKGDVEVTGNHTSTISFENLGVSISGGATAGATVDTSSIKNVTNAYISENSNVYANDLTVDTYVKDDIAKQLAGVAVGGLTVSGVVEVNNISKNSSAYIDNSGIYASGNVYVKAYNQTRPHNDAGNGTKGTIVASGTSTVNKINNSTKACITGSSVNSLKEISVSAEGDDGVDNLGIAATLGNYALTGVVMINVIKSTVDAFIGENSNSPLLINQYSEYQGSLPGQKLTVKAKNSADVQDTAGKADLTTANVGAVLDVSKLVNRTVAQIGKNTKAYVAGDVSIESNSVKKLGSTLVSAEGGILNINGAISLLTIGESNNENAGKEISPDLINSLNSDVSKKEILKNSEDSQAVEGKNSYAQHEAPDIEELLSFSTAKEAVTGAFIEDGTDENDSVKLTCGGTLSIKVNGNIESKSDVGEVAASVIPFGSSVSLTDIKDSNGAYIGKYSQVSAQNLNINSTLTETASVKSREAVFAGLAAGYNLAKLDVIPVMSAYISDNAKVSIDKNININTRFIPENSSEIMGLSVSTASVNVSNAFSNVNPVEESFIGKNAKVSSGLKKLAGNPEVTFVGQAKTEGEPQLKFEKMKISGEQLVIKKVGEGKKVISVEKVPAVDNSTASTDTAAIDNSNADVSITGTGSTIGTAGTTDGESVTSEVYSIGSITRSAGDFIADGYYIGQIITVQKDSSGESTGNVSSENSVTANVYGLSYEILEVTPQTIKVTLNCIGEIKDETLDNYVLIGDNKITRSEGSFIDEGFGEDGISISEGEDINYYNVNKISDDGKVMYVDRNFRVTKDGKNVPYEFKGEVKKGPVVQSINKDSIVRSTGTWADEGIEIGDSIVIIGTKFNDGQYVVSNIEDGNKLVLDCSGKIKNETASNIHIDKPAAEVSNDSSIEISSRSDKKAAPANKAYKSGIAVGEVSVDVSVTKAVYTEKLNSTIASDAMIFTKGRLGIGSSSNVSQNAQVQGYGANAVDISNMFADSVVSSVSKSAIGENANIFAGALEIISEENQNSTVKAVNGSGSAVGSVYMKGGSNTGSAAEVEIGENANIKAIRVAINSTGTNVLDNLADAITVGGLVLGNSASETASHVKSNINIGNNAVIDSGTFEIAAKTNTEKSEVNSEKSVKSLIGGLIVETTALTDLDVTSDAVINVGDNVTLKADTNSKNSAVMFTENNVKANDKITLKVADVISIPVIADCDFDVATNSKINIGKNTSILSSGDVNIESLSNATAKSNVDVTVAGAISVATIGKSDVETYADNNITLGTGSKIKANGFVNMLSGLNGYNVPTVTGVEQTGDDINYREGNFDISANAIINNYHIVPIHTTGKGYAKLDEKNTITVDGDIYASRDVKIFANPGKTLVGGIGECNNIYSKAVGARIRNSTGDAIINQNNVYINGIIDASINEKVYFKIKEDGTVSEDSSKKVDYTVTEENVLTNLVNEYNRLQKLLVEYVGTNPQTGKMTSVEVGLRIQLELVTSELKDMGYWDKDADMIKLSRMSSFINLSPITSALTSVFIEGNRVDYDLNKISVSTEASVDIENESSYTLRLKDVIIPDNNGGYVYVNGYQKRRGNSSSPVADIKIHNKYTNTGKSDIKVLGDIEITGNIENKAGDIEISSTGGIIVKGVISAGKNVNIDARGKFVQKYVDALIHLGGEPRKLFYNIENVKSNIKGSSVFITAREINVNGKIQAGNDKQQLIIDDAIISQIKTYESSKLVTTSYKDCPLSNDSSNIKAYWDPVAKKIVVENIDAQGGSIYIAGQVISTIKDDKGTPTGEIAALDGFSNINIVNKSNYEIEFNDIDVGLNFEGRITITDTAPMVYTPDLIKEPVTKVYTRKNGKVQVEVLNDGNGGSSGRTDIENAVYNPLKGLRYTWVTGQRSLTREDITYCTATFWGIDWLAKDPGDVVSYEKILLDKVPLLEGEYVEYRPKVEAVSSEDLDEKYLEQKTYDITIKERELKYSCNWSETYPWYKFKKNKYYTRKIYETGNKTISRSSINADAPIKINFIGAEDFGTFSVDSKQGAVKFNRSFGNNSTNIILDSAGISAAPSVVLSVYGITLNSVSSIGDLQNPLGIDTPNGMAVNINALNGGAYLSNDNGGLIIGDANVPNGDIVISAFGDIKQNDPSKSIISKGIDFTSKTGKITGICLSKIENPLKAKALGDISISVLNGDAKVDSVVSQQGTVKIDVPEGNLCADGKNPKIGLLDYKDDKFIVNTNVKPVNIKGTEVILTAHNIGGTALTEIEKASLDKAVIDSLSSIPNCKTTPGKKIVYRSPLTVGDIKGEFISLLQKDEKTGLTQYIWEEIQKLPNPAKITNNEAFVQMLNSIIFVEYNKFYNKAVTLLGPDSVTKEMKDLMDNSSKTVEEAQWLNRLILEACYPKEIKKSVPREIDITIVELPYINDLNIETGKLSVVSGYEEDVTDPDGSIKKKFVPGNVYLCSTSQIGVASVRGGDILLASDKGIVKADGSAAGIINGKRVILTAEGGDIGSEKNPLEVYADKVSGKSQGVVSIATKDIDNDKNTKENINVGYIYGLDTVSLNSSGAIKDANSSSDYNVESRNPKLVSADGQNIKVNKLPMPVVIASDIPKKYSEDDHLRKLEIYTPGNEIIKLTPDFTPDNLNYSASVPNNIRNVIVKLEKDSLAAAKISGNTDLKEGRNVISILVTAENGNSRTYTIEVTREETKTDDPKVVPGAKFTDISGHWAEQAILSLLGKGIINGYADNTFRPNKKITRAEVAVLLMKAKGIVPVKNAKLDFKDSSKVPSWAAGYIYEAVKAGVITGYPDKTVKPDKEITRAEAIVMIMKAFGKSASSTRLSGFKDSKSIPAWASGYITTAFSEGFIKGYSDNTIKPDNSITRAEAASIISKCIEAADAEDSPEQM